MKYLFYVVVFFLPLWAWSQPGFNRSYDMGELAATFTSVELSGDTIVVYGTAKEAGAPAFGMLFARLDTLGNVIDYKIYNDSLGDTFTLTYQNSFIKLSDGSGYAGVGQIFYRVNGYLALFDNEGAVTKYIEYKDSVSVTDFYRQIKELDDGFLILGEKQSPVTYYREIFALKTDFDGHIIWEKKYPTPNRLTFFGQALIINNNEYVIGGTSTVPTNVPLNQVNSISKIFAIDSLGNIKWQWQSQPSLEELGVGKIFKTQEGNWLYSSARGWYNATFNEISRQPKVIIRDENFNLIHQDTFDVAENTVTVFFNMIQLNDGGWLALGIKPVNYALPPISDEANALSGWLVKIDNQANKLWSRVDTAFWSAQTGSTNYWYNAVELPGGSIVVCGYSRTYDPVPKDWAWLIKINKDGCVDTLSCATVPVTPENLPANLVNIYPNPTSSVIRIESSAIDRWDKIEVIDMAGRIVKSLEYSDESRVDLSEQENGVYFIRLTKSNQSVIKKVVKQRG